MKQRKKSPRQAIKEHCVGCIYDPAEPGNKFEQTENCTVTVCELYDYRPLSFKTRKALREQL